MADTIINGIRAASKNIWFYVFSIVGIVLMLVSFIIPPTGVIDDSVLKGVAWVFGFAALAIVNHAINVGADAKIQHGETSIEINSPDK